MTPQTFAELLRRAFGDTLDLPIAIYYSDTAAATTPKGDTRCLFSHLATAMSGRSVTLSADNVICGGGKFYCGFTPMPEYVPEFVSLKERYKQTPEQVRAYASHVEQATKPYLNLVRIDRLESFEGVEAVVFFASPDALSGLAMWAFFDNDAPDAVSALFGSGCSSVITQAVMENRRSGHRTFLGMFDPSARIHIRPDHLSLAIPMSRLKVMLTTLADCCLYDTNGWSRVRERMESV